MSLDNIKNAIKEFLSNDTPEVLCLRGKWGVGKTYLWKHYYDELKESKYVNLKNYSYVSLFGIGSVQDLKLEILSKNNELTKSIGRLVPLATSASVMGMNLGNFEKVLTQFRFNSVKNYIICIDDIERKSKSLIMEDLLGFICYLRDEKSCKVIILQNSDALEEDSSDKLKKYAEKIIDYDITLEPTAEDAANIALGDKKEMESIRGNIIKLGINNIRIIKKIQNHAAQILHHLPKDKFQKETIKSALGTLCLYCDSHYAPNSDKPNIEFIMRYKSWVGIKDDRSELEKKWDDMLRNYGYSGTDNLDREIFSFIKNGYVNALAFEKSALELDRQYQVGTVENEYRNAWSLYHDSFQDNVKEVLDGVYCCFKNAVKTLSPDNMNGVYILFKDLGDEERAKKILEFYIKERSDTPELFDSDSSRLWTFDKPHPDIKEAFEKTFQLYKKNNPTPFNEAFERIVENGSNKDYEESLRNATIEEFYAFYKALHKKNVYSYVREALKFETYSDNRTKIGIKARKALEQLASESLINQRRLKRLGITIDNNSSDSNS